MFIRRGMGTQILISKGIMDWMERKKRESKQSNLLSSDSLVTEMFEQYFNECLDFCCRRNLSLSLDLTVKASREFCLIGGEIHCGGE